MVSVIATMILGAGSLLEGKDHPRAEDANFLTLNAYFTSIGGGTDQIADDSLSPAEILAAQATQREADANLRAAQAARQAASMSGRTRCSASSHAEAFSTNMPAFQK